jgi:hypothetical protein
VERLGLSQSLQRCNSATKREREKRQKANHVREEVRYIVVKGAGDFFHASHLLINNYSSPFKIILVYNGHKLTKEEWSVGTINEGNKYSIPAVFTSTAPYLHDDAGSCQRQNRSFQFNPWPFPIKESSDRQEHRSQ